jgi:ubiquinone/menaquinone biosynthesis C-methylase UbiE
MSRSQETNRVVRQFDTVEQASRYGSEFNSRRHQRIRRVIVEALTDLPEGSRILDLPCGTGRLLPLLLELGYRYVGADSSPHMVEATREKLDGLQKSAAEPLEAELEVQDITALTYPENAFDAVIVNRLFHHFTRAETRIAALKELNRVCRGPIFVFFLNTWTANGLIFHLKHSIDRPKQRLPISLAEFRANGAAAGLELTAHWPTRGRYGKEWYARFDRA